MNGQPITPADVRRVKSLLGRGYGPARVAKSLGIPVSRVHRITDRHGGPPPHLTLLTDLAAEVGVSTCLLRRHAGGGILPASRWGGRLVYTREQAQAVRDYYAEHGTPDTSWLTAAQTARELGCAPNRLHRVRDRIAARHGVTIRRVKLRAAAGNTWRYHPEDVARAARCEPRLFRGRPRDHVSTKVLAGMAGKVTNTPVIDWAAKGCPHVRDHLRRLWFRPADVLAWLHTIPPHRHNESAIANLTAALHVEVAA